MASVEALKHFHSTPSVLAGLPLDLEAYEACRRGCAGCSAAGEFEFEHNFWGRISRVLVEGRFTGFVHVACESGHRGVLAVLDGVVFGACVELPDGGVKFGEEAVAELEAVASPATIQLYRRRAEG